ncbi:MAG: YebC/PmpR family DNA-binding transcriptional regulator [Candidatus Andersenbacteria bacterium]|nr:YebC/PmpR family DNA-binding transcriptional regulator [bacterium]MDZ4225650.1 YebC/PmpR family DNA-binding transcriptional regulator [Candidatus Andersenbacteria bacterium]
MSGHSKWRQIKHKKALTDSKRSQLFGRLSREIRVAAQTGNDPNTNSALRDAIARAKKANLPQANIDRLLNQPPGDIAAATYEGYGPGGASLLITVATDNTNRTVSEIRSLLKKHGGSLGGPGSVRWKFIPQIIISAALLPDTNKEDLELHLIDAGATDFKISQQNLTVSAPPHVRSTLENTLAQFNLTDFSVGLGFVVPAAQRTPLNQAQAQQLQELLHELSDHPDVLAVYTDQE